MSLASILKRSDPAATAQRHDESFKLSAIRQPRGYDKIRRHQAAAASSADGAVILRGILRPLHACGLFRVPEPHFSGDVMMNKTLIFSRSRRLAARFRRANGGNVAVMFAIAILPIMGFVGAAVDYTRVNNARTAMQAALDTTALMLSKDVTGLSASEINEKAQKYFAALYKQHPEAQNVAITATYTNSAKNGSKIVLNASATMETNFMKVAGYPQIDFGTSSTTVWGTTKLRVALALDNTGSMSSSGKMNALKKAAKDLIDQLKTAAKNDGDVYISIVPFAKDVNVGSIADTSTKWLRWDLGQCTKSNGWWGSTDLGFTTQSDCNTQGGSWTAVTKTGWTGCVSDRYETPTAYDTLSTAPYGVTQTATNINDRNTQFPAENYSDCPTSILPLTYDWTALKNKVDAMQPRGNTNQAIGMAWAWLSLLQQSPLNAPAEDSNFKYNKVIILLSDGDNTQNRFSSNQNTIDGRQKLLCDNAKAAGIQVYTIQVNTNNDNNSSVMSYCASSSNNYFSTTTAGGINTAFSSIGASLSRLRIAQ
jgi:Flp pilus assembly protein TadG